MIILFKNIEVYSPMNLGKRDVLVIGSKIAKIDYNIDSFENVDKNLIKIIDGNKKILVPGFIDSHVHILGGGGEGGYKTRTPEIMLSEITKAGVTTIVGCLGTDSVTRNMNSLIAKARGLEEEGITTYVYSGSYQVPIKTTTNSIQDDLVLIDKIIGVGEIALSDHRSSQPSVEDIMKVAGNTRVGGILSAKAGILNIHVGSGKSGLSILKEIVKNTEIPITQFLPTHMNRNEEVFKSGLEYASMGGYIDFTTSTSKELEMGDIRKSSSALKLALENNIDISNITFSSDAQGSLPEFDENGKYIGLGVANINSLFKEVKDSIIDEKIPIEKAISVITKNPAEILKLNNKGVIKEGLDADLVCLDKDTLDILDVISLGKFMVRDGVEIVKGTFEK